MATFKMEELRESVLGRASDVRIKPEKRDQGGGTAVGRRKRRTVEETRELIRSFMAEQNEPVPLMDICEYLDREPSAQLRAIMRDLETAGEIVTSSDYGAGPSIPRFLYGRS